MRVRNLVWTVAAAVLLAAACAGKADESSSWGGAAGTPQAGAGGTTSGCPADLELLASPVVCAQTTASCTTGLCLRGQGSWNCTTPCPCPDGWQCTAFPGGAQGCVPAAWAHCLSNPDAGAGGASGMGGAGGAPAGGASGTGGTGAYGGAGGGWGGAGGVAGAGGGEGGSGPCSGFPACPTNLAAKFCDGASLLECAAGQSCPTPTACSDYCPACTCHVAPPINGVLNAGCDTCLTDADCKSDGLKCADDPMLKGSGAKACVMK